MKFDQADAVFVRTPPVDPRTPDTSDLDFLAFADIPELYPERLHATEGRRALYDVTWVPSAWLDDPRQMAARGLIAHRLASSEPLFYRSSDVEARCTASIGHLYQWDIQHQRLLGFFEMAFLTVREIGITWTFPGLALFWVHMAYAACLAAALDGVRKLCPNVYTRPLEYADQLESSISAGVRNAMVRDLRLHVDAPEVAAAVRRIHDVVATRFPEPAWPDVMRATTRFEYRYWLAREESDWRLSVAEEMRRRGDAPAAVYYLRFYAYALARAPMVHARALEGRDVSYLRPEKAVLPDLLRWCPEIVDDLNVVFTGTREPDAAVVDAALSGLHRFREIVLDVLSRSDATVLNLPSWTPYVSPVSVSEAPCQT
jgi:hypothetical protein